MLTPSSGVASRQTVHVGLGSLPEGSWVNLANVTQGPSGNSGDELRKKLAAQGKRLPLLGSDAETANRQYTKYFALGRDRARGAAHNLAWAEYFHYIGPEGSEWDKYVVENAVPL